VRVLVTGSHGYVGSVVAPLLAEAGHDVVGLDAFFYRGCDFGPEVGRVETRWRDVREVVPSELEGFNAIVHLAALSNDPLGDLDASLTAEINCDATLRLARAAREAGVGRFVFASSCSMYGASETDSAVDENAPLRPLTSYAESKVRSEEGLVELAGPDFAPVSMRNATVFGVSPRLRLDIVLNNLAAWSHTTGRIRLLSDGRAWRPLVHVRDVAKATLALLEAPEDDVRGEAVNVGSDQQNYLIRDLADQLSQITGCIV
jgi:nucleoside-diphosphate-sugar epimerase